MSEADVEGRRFSSAIVRRLRQAGSCLIVVIAAAWLTTGVVIVAPSERGLYERCGATASELLGPGLHFVLPAPWGKVRRADVSSVRVLGRPAAVDASSEPVYLSGDATELVVVRTWIAFQVVDSWEGVRDHLLANGSPERQLAALAERIVTRDSATGRLEDLLSRDRAEWCEASRRRLQTESDERRLGVAIRAFELQSVEPPSATQASYREVMSARLDADRDFETARGAAAGELVRMEMAAASEIADARAASSGLGARARDLGERIRALSNVETRDDGWRHAIRCREWSRELSRVALVLVDPELSPDARLRLDDPAVVAPGAAP